MSTSKPSRVLPMLLLAASVSPTLGACRDLEEVHAEIEDFDVSSDSVRPGDSLTFSWATGSRGYVVSARYAKLFTGELDEESDPGLSAASDATSGFFANLAFGESPARAHELTCEYLGPDEGLSCPHGGSEGSSLVPISLGTTTFTLRFCALGAGRATKASSACDYRSVSVVFEED